MSAGRTPPRSDMDTGAPRRSGDDGGRSDWVDCAKCGVRHRLEFWTKGGRLYERPLRCGGSGEPKQFKRRPALRCADCGSDVKGSNHRCDDCKLSRARAHYHESGYGRLRKYVRAR